jgi:hypothetical protein
MDEELKDEVIETLVDGEIANGYMVWEDEAPIIQTPEDIALEYRQELLKRFKNMTITTLKGPVRLADESYEEYKLRREIEKIYTKMYLRGKFR